MARSLGKNVVAGVVDQQKAGYMKDLCDEYITLKKEDFNQCMR